MELWIWLRKNKMTQKNLAEVLGISQAAVTNLVNGKNSPTLLTAMIIEEFTDNQVTWQELIDEDTKQKYENYLNSYPKKSK